MESRPIFAAIGLFFGGLIVGSSGGGSREGSAHAATTPMDGKPEVAARAPGSRGLVSPALRKTQGRGSVDLDSLAIGSSGGRCALKSSAHRPVTSRFDDALNGLKLPALPIARPALVMQYVQHFSESYEGRKNFADALRRSGQFYEIIAKSLRERGLPADLAAVVLVESAFAPEAVSPAGAAGLWQFMPSTGRAYGLAIESTVDERLGIWQSTDAAAHHLADLYERFRSWELALAAYNIGYEGLERRLDEGDTDDFWTLADMPDILPKETATYVPKVLAAAIVLQNLEELGFGDVEKLPALDAGELEVPGGTKLAIVARAAGTSVRVIQDLNPELLTDVVPDRGEKRTLHVPRAGVARARVMLPKLASEEGEPALRVSDDFDWGKDDVHAGRSRLERTSTATRTRTRKRHVKRHSTPIESAAKAKPIEERRLEEPKPREKLAAAEDKDEEPELSEPAAPEPPPRAPAPPPPAAPPAPTTERVFYRVVPGDSVAQIAATVGLTVDQVLAQAHVSTADQIKVGALLDLRVPKDGVSDTRHPVAR